MGIVQTMKAEVDGTEYEAEVEIFSAEPQVEEGYVLDIMKTSPVTPAELKAKVYDVFHSLVLKLAAKGDGRS